jgi:hypothetical protein
MADLIDGTYATGTNVYRAGHDYTPEKSDSGSSDDDGPPSTQPINPTPANHNEVRISLFKIWYHIEALYEEQHLQCYSYHHFQPNSNLSLT